LAIVPHLEFLLRVLPGYSVAQPMVDALAMRQWRRHRLPPAPRPVKAALIRRFASHHSRTVFIETGTFYGDMLAALRSDFDRLYSIELHEGLGRRAIRRFVGDPKISIIVGDSAAELQPLLQSIGRPAVLWLDGPYSGFLTARGDSDTPISRELEAAFKGGTMNDVVLIDDARLFGTNSAYPDLAEIERRVRDSRPGWSLRVEDDIVIISPP